MANNQQTIILNWHVPSVNLSPIISQCFQYIIDENETN